jgi:hypothetical protein
VFISRTLATQGEFAAAAAGFKVLPRGTRACDIGGKTMTPLAQAFAASPDLFPAALDPRSGVVTLWRLSCVDYQQSAFLDGRIATERQSRQLPFAVLAAAVQETALAENCHFIFHIGHVGSTLLSRLLGKHPALFSLREPDILRTLATTFERSRRDTYLPPLLKLWSRTYEPKARALIKTTSFVAEIALDLLARPYNPRALVMGVAPEIYLATIVGGANAPAEARALAPMRLAQLKRRLSAELRVENLTDGEIAAVGWACESLCLSEATRSAGVRSLVLDFEKFLANPHEVLGRTFAHFGASASDSEITAILAGNEMRSYSKAPEFEYDAGTRHAVLAESRERHGYEIRQGLIWLERAAAEHSSIADALSLFN